MTAPRAHRKGSTVDECLNDGVWITRCVARLIEFDPQLDPELARPVAEDMGSRQRWRSMAPEDAARTVFHFGSKPEAPQH